MTTKYKIAGSKTLWTRMSNTFSTFGETMTMKMADKEMQVVAVDGTHVALLKMTVPDDAFEYYEVQGKRDLYLELDMMKRCLKTLKKPLDIASLEYSDERDSTLVSWTSTYQDSTGRVLDESATQNPRMPEMDWEGKPECTVPTDWLLDALLAAREYDEIVTFAISEIDNGEELWFSVSVQRKDGTGTTVKYPLGTVEGAMDQQSYNLAYLVPHVRRIKISKCKETTLQFCQHWPLLVTNEWDDGTICKMFLAPRMPNDL